MNYNFTEEQIDLQLMTREFVKKEIIPIAAEYDKIMAGRDDAFGSASPL